MSVEEFTSIIKQIQPYTKYIYLHVLGEPLLHPHLSTFLQIAKAHDIQVNLTSNGTLLKQHGQALIGNIRQLNLSLHAFSEHDGQLPKQYLQDCFTMADALAAQGTYISYRLWNMGSKDNDEILRQLQLHYPISLTHEAKQRLQQRIFLHLEQPFLWPSLKQQVISQKGYCLGMKDMCAILVDGSVVPCCLDSLGECCFGNIFTTSFSDLLQSQRVKDMQMAFRQRNVIEPLCQRCAYRLRFDKKGGIQ